MRPSNAKRHPELLECFNRNPFPPKEEMLELSKSTGLELKTLQKWFSDERYKRMKAGESFVRPTLSNQHPELEKQFEIDPYSTEHHKELALKTGLSLRQVKQWFMRKRVATDKVASSKASDFAEKYPELVRQFETNPYITQIELDDLVSSTSLTEIQIKNWFSYRLKKYGMPVQEYDMASKYPQLAEQFKKNPHPYQSDMSRLIEDTGLTRIQIYNWFRNKQKSSGLKGPVLSDKVKTLRENYPQLDKQFNINPHPTEDEKKKLLEMTGLQKHTLDNWFVTERRIKSLRCKKPDQHHGQSLTKKFPELDQQFKLNPYPTEAEKLKLVKATGLSRTQINGHFRYRRRTNT